jgi:hypothetical protein
MDLGEDKTAQRDKMRECMATLKLDEIPTSLHRTLKNCIRIGGL